MEFVRARPSRPPGLEGYIEVDREDMLPDDERIIYDDPDWVEEEDVIGVHYEDDEGNLLPLPHGPEQVGDEERRTNILDPVDVQGKEEIERKDSVGNDINAKYHYT